MDTQLITPEHIRVLGSVTECYEAWDGHRRQGWRVLKPLYYQGKGKGFKAVIDLAKVAGTAWRCKDGLVRWFTHESTRGHLSILWLDEASGIWHHGGTVQAARWLDTGPFEQVKAPGAGECIRVAGATGIVSERTLHGIESKAGDGAR